MIKIKPEADLSNNEGFALYINGHRAHLGTFNTISDLRSYWHSFRRELTQGMDSISKLIFG